MKKVVSCFVNGYYYNQFLVMYKSYIYYGNTVQFRVYDWDRNNPLTQQGIDYLKAIGVEVVRVDVGDWDKRVYSYQYGFKWKGLIESDATYEILVDADTLFLDNIEELFQQIQVYDFIVVPEMHRNIDDEAIRVGDLFNIGFFVVNHRAKDYLRESVEMLKADKTRLEMESLCEILKGKDSVYELPWEQYMNLWQNHKGVKKSLVIEEGKPKIILEDGRSMKFYHFTTMIDPYKDSLINRLNVEEKTAVRMWVKRHNNPAVFIYEYFKNAEEFNTLKETIESWKV